MNYFGGSKIARQYKVNEQIRSAQVRVIGENGEQLGVMSLDQALQMAREQEVDLVEVAPNAEPPVARLLDYGKLRYLYSKKERESKKGQKNTELKEVRFRPNIGIHDLNSKMRKVREFIDDGSKVKLTVRFRGREAVHQHGIDMDPAVVDRAHGVDRLVIHGDAASDAVLALAHVERARLLVVALPDPVSAIVTAQHARRLNPSLRIVGRVGWPEEAEAMRHAGADAVVWPEMEAALEIMRACLVDFGLSPERVVQLVGEGRATLAFAEDGELEDAEARPMAP